MRALMTTSPSLMRVRGNRNPIVQRANVTAAYKICETQDLNLYAALSLSVSQEIRRSGTQITIKVAAFSTFRPQSHHSAIALFSYIIFYNLFSSSAYRHNHQRSLLSPTSTHRK